MWVRVWDSWGNIVSPLLVWYVSPRAWLDNWWQISSNSWLVWNAFSLLYISYLHENWFFKFWMNNEHWKAIHKQNSINLNWNNECWNKYFIKRLVAVSYQLFYDVAWKCGLYKKLIIHFNKCKNLKPSESWYRNSSNVAICGSIRFCSVAWTFSFFLFFKYNKKGMKSLKLFHLKIFSTNRSHAAITVITFITTTLKLL